MICKQTGKICEGLYGTGHYFMPAFLLASPAAVLFDAGVAAMGPHYLKDIETYLGRKESLKYLLLTHSHYDHCGSVPFLANNIPGLSIGTNAYAAVILKKPSAVGLIRELGSNFVNVFRDHLDEDIPFDPINVNLVLKDGDELDCGEGWTVQILETPGHTNDSLSYYIPRIKALIAGEAVGVFQNGGILPEFLSSYEDYVASLEKLAGLDVDVLALAHGYILTGDDVASYMMDSIERTSLFRDRIERYLDRFGGDRERTVNAICLEDYDETVHIQQDKKTFLINLEAQVRAVAERR